MATIPVRYVGAKRHFKDHLYGSEAVFTKGKVTKVPDWAAAQLLRHPEFEDARESGKGQPIIAKREFTLAEIDRDREELDALSGHVRLDSMTIDQMTSYAMRVYGVRVEQGLKADVTSAVRNLMQRNQAGVR
jgi:hypothetical protein